MLTHNSVCRCKNVGEDVSYEECLTHFQHLSLFSYKHTIFIPLPVSLSPPDEMLEDLIIHEARFSINMNFCKHIYAWVYVRV